MKQMRAGAFNAKCLTVLNDVQATGEPVVVTKRGKPIVKIFPIESDKNDLFGFMAGKFKIVGTSRHRWSPMSPEVHEKMIPLDTVGQSASRKLFQRSM